jgi:hypothetical protein
MAVSIGGTPSGFTTTGANSITVAHTAAGTDRAVGVGVGISSGGTLPAINGATYGGNAMTAAFASITTGGTRQRQFQLAGDASIATTSQNVVASLSGTADELVLTVVSFQGVDSATPIGTPVTSVTGSATPSVTVGSVSADDMLFGFVYAVSNVGDLTLAGCSPGADQTQGTEHLDSGGFAYGASSYQDGVAGGVMSWSLSGGVPDFGTTIGAFAFLPSTGAVANPARGNFLSLLGVS